MYKLNPTFARTWTHTCVQTQDFLDDAATERPLNIPPNHTIARVTSQLNSDVLNDGIIIVIIILRSSQFVQ